MTNNTIRIAEVEQDLAAILVSEGITPVHAEQLAKRLAQALHCKYRRRLWYWRRDDAYLVDGIDVEAAGGDI